MPDLVSLLVEENPDDEAWLDSLLRLKRRNWSPSNNPTILADCWGLRHFET